MKRHLLAAVFAASALSIAAQAPQHITEVRDVPFRNISQYTDTRNVNIGNMYYYRPHGVFYSGWNRDLRNPFVAFAPINTELTFTSDCQSGTPVWEYTDAGGSIITSSDASITISLGKGTYPAPRVFNADNTDDAYCPTSEMEVGGYTRSQKIDGKIMDACAVNYVPEGKVYTASTYFCTKNPSADANLADALKLDKIHVRGFGEEFSSPSKMTVGGFGILLSGEEDIIKNPQYMDARILVSEGNEYKVLKSNSDLNVTVSTIEGLQGMYHVQYNIKDGNITVMPGTKIIPVVSCENIKMTPMFDGQMRYSASEPNVTTMYIDADVDGTQRYMQVKGFAINDGTDIPRFINSWCISLDMSYAESDPSGIDNVVSDDMHENAVYNLMGVKVADNQDESLPAGIYIVNGRKKVL